MRTKLEKKQLFLEFSNFHKHFVCRFRYFECKKDHEKISISGFIYIHGY